MVFAIVDIGVGKAWPFLLIVDRGDRRTKESGSTSSSSCFIPTPPPANHFNFCSFYIMFPPFSFPVCCAILGSG